MLTSEVLARSGTYELSAKTPAMGFLLVIAVNNAVAPPWLKPPIIMRSEGILHSFAFFIGN